MGDLQVTESFFGPTSSGCTIVAQMLPNTGRLPNNEATHPNVTY